VKEEDANKGGGAIIKGNGKGQLKGRSRGVPEKTEKKKVTVHR